MKKEVQEMAEVKKAISTPIDTNKTNEADIETLANVVRQVLANMN